jgi:hypothetical protein
MTIGEKKEYSEAYGNAFNNQKLNDELGVLQAAQENKNKSVGLTEFFKVLGAEDVNTDENIAKLKELKAEYDL